MIAGCASVLRRASVRDQSGAMTTRRGRGLDQRWCNNTSLGRQVDNLHVPRQKEKFRKPSMKFVSIGTRMRTLGISLGWS